MHLLTSKKLLTIIIPIYNSEQYLDRCLSTVCSQLNNDYELLLINDNSTDNSLNIINYYRTNKSIVLINNKQNLGPGPSRNLGIDHSRSKYITFIDSDDYVSDNYFENLISKAELEQSEITFSKLQIINNRSFYDSFYENYKDNNLNYAELPLLVGSTAPWRKLYRHNFINKYKLRFCEKSYIGEDIPFTWIGYACTNSISFADNCYYYYQENSDGCDSIIDERIFNLFECLKETESNIKKRKKNIDTNMIRKLIINHTYYNYKKLTNASVSFNFAKRFISNARLALDFSSNSIDSIPYLTDEEKLFAKTILFSNDT